MKKKLVMLLIALVLLLGLAGFAACTDGFMDTNNSIQDSDIAQTEGLVYNLSEDKNYYILIDKGIVETTDIVIPAKYNNLPVKEIADYAFEDCQNLTSVVIPEGVNSIGDYAFV